MTKMLGRPNPQSVDARDYDVAPSKDFVQLKHVPAHDWSRGAARQVAEPDLDPEIDDIIGGGEGDVLDLQPERADKLRHARVPGFAFGPKSGPDPPLGLQTLSDTELDYANGVVEEREVLYPNHDFVRRRQGIGGAMRFDKMVLGGTRSEPDDDEDDIFPYLAEGNAPIDPKWTAVEPKVKNGRFAVRRAEFMKLHKKAKEREAAREAEAAGELVLNPHLMTGTLRHKPSASLAFSARHDTLGHADDELDDGEAFGEYHDGPAKTRGGPAAYEPRYGFKDPHSASSHFGKEAGRPSLEENSIDDIVDNRDFMGGIYAAKQDPSRVVPNTALSGANFSKSVGRVDRAAEDHRDFPETHAEGDVLDLNPKKIGSGVIRGGIDMDRTTGRVEKDELDIEAEAVRLDLMNLDGLKRKKVLGAHSFARTTGRPETDTLDQPEGDSELHPDHRAVTAQTPSVVFTAAARFEEDDFPSGGSDLNPRDDATRRRAPTAVFGSALARPEPLNSEEAQSQIDPVKVALHVPGVDFSHGAAARPPTPPLEDAATAMRPGHDSALVTSISHSFARAKRPDQAGPSDEQRLTLTFAEPFAGGAVFGTELRPGQRPTIIPPVGNVLHPDLADDAVRKSPPEWSFPREKRWDSKLDAFVNAKDPQLSLHPDRSAIEPKSPAAFFPEERRMSQWTNSDPNEQVLALMPNADAVLARHPAAFLTPQARFPPEEDHPKQLNLHPNIDAIKPNAPSATVTGRPAPIEPLVEGNRLQLYPTPMYPAAPSAHITTAKRPTHNNIDEHTRTLNLHPQYDLQHPRSPAFSMGARLHSPDPDEDGILDLLSDESSHRTRQDRPRDTKPPRRVGYEVDLDESDSALSASFGLPETGVVGNAASLVRARREKQAIDQARAKEKQAKEDRRNRMRAAANYASDVVPSGPPVQVDIISARMDARDELTAVRHSFHSHMPSSLHTMVLDAPRRTPPTHDAPPTIADASAPPPRKTVQFAAEDDVQEAPTRTKGTSGGERPSDRRVPSKQSDSSSAPRRTVVRPAGTKKDLPSSAASITPAVARPTRSSSPLRPILKSTATSQVDSTSRATDDNLSLAEYLNQLRISTSSRARET